MNEMANSQVSVNRLLNVTEAARYLGVSIFTLYTWVNQRKIPHYKIGRLLKFNQGEISAWISERKVAAKEF